MTTASVWRALLGLLFVMILGCGRASAASPVLTLLFTGNTYGNYEPCPS